MALTTLSQLLIAFQCPPSNLPPKTHQSRYSITCLLGWIRPSWVWKSKLIKRNLTLHQNERGELYPRPPGSQRAGIIYGGTPCPAPAALPSWVVWPPLLPKNSWAYGPRSSHSPSPNSSSSLSSKLASFEWWPLKPSLSKSTNKCSGIVCFCVNIAKKGELQALEKATCWDARLLLSFKQREAFTRLVHRWGQYWHSYFCDWERKKQAP